MAKLSLFGLSRLFSSADSGYEHISSADAAAIMASGKNHIVVDVRQASEFANGHIPGAVNLPNESIGTTEPALLSDKAQLILVHCLSGARSRQAARKLAAMGYINVKDFGGLNTWRGRIVRG